MPSIRYLFITSIRRFKKVILPAFFVSGIFYFFPNFGCIAQSLNNYDKVGFSVGPTILFKNTNESIRNIDYLVIPSLSLSYQKNINTFIEVKSSIGWQYIDQIRSNMDDILNVSNPSTTQSMDRGSIFSAEMIPLFFTNPDRIGYIPSVYKFYMGVGLGLFTSTIRNTSFPKLTENDLVLIEYGLFDQRQTTRNLNFSAYIPYKMGIIKSLGKSFEIGAEFSLIYSFSNSFIPNQSNQNFLSQFQILINKRLNK